MNEANMFSTTPHHFDIPQQISIFDVLLRPSQQYLGKERKDVDIKVVGGVRFSKLTSLANKI
ncbi:hypothetical protein A3C21_00380 [Candidatus Kaiserbacteria bacterium RIFCSPHIGHO2_02_FULL_59_21]|uniref:Uncharacterized protein n=2 Tax=Candidatus Kaiseribacteriota TaxID=1752734 RepID=A0A0G1YTS1_9BACT|nr:MAG: hypothetical protein UY98_C0025G0005 [Candidatus Kaiserbacteria bacterium GW2011_GWA2_58_9]OGG67619.1 MAG: hypothetical protein A3C21_00380 [Candidatus Kaiserbacteria bacterium RIFCSPHIGHO2_02_FULL_59_21]OGG80387.1 MAG: hypothetical protein A2952_01530 [Candidatus Kaiserbacteria bacterium RIFCSPLOWO2_01_FULL_59_34]OGG86307.1 MAG: hypothetical protein A3I47_04000 [Candidatus Kaiserbacteria bacterium RIFCSPLOWO2_02_FULL_59_19]